MPSLFPALLDFSIIGIFFVRVVTGLFFWVFGARLIRAAYTLEGRTILRTLGFIYGFAKLAIGLLVTVGLFTQAAALFGMLFSALTFLQGAFSHSNKSAQQVQILLFIMSLSLLFLGAGAFAFDYHL